MSAHRDLADTVTSPVGASTPSREKARQLTTLLLCGGLGTRMRPIASDDQPKSMVPFLNRPLIDYLLDLLARSAYHDVVLTSEHPSFVSHLEQRAPDSLRIRYAEPEGEWRGTANCVRQVERLLGDGLSDPYLVIYGDSLLRADLQAMTTFHLESRAAVTILHHRPDFAAFVYEPVAELGCSEPRTNYGVMECDSLGTVRSFIEKPTLKELSYRFRDPVANAAVYILNRGILGNVGSASTLDFAEDVFPELIQKGMRVLTFPVGEDGYREDVGTLDRYLDLHMRALSGRLAVATDLGGEDASVSIASDASVATDVRLSPPVMIGRACSVESGATLKCCCVGDAVRVSENATVSFSVVHSKTFIGEGARVERCLIGAESRVGRGVVVPGGTVVGAHSHFGHPRIAPREA